MEKVYSIHEKVEKFFKKLEFLVSWFPAILIFGGMILLVILQIKPVKVLIKSNLDFIKNTVALTIITVCLFLILYFVIEIKKQHRK